MKGQFKDEFVTAGGIPLSEVLSLSLSLSCTCSCRKLTLFLVFVKIALGTMESRIRSNLFFAGEVV